MCLKILLSLLVGGILFCVLFYFFYFLRMPERIIPDDETLFVSPANGKIIAIIENPTEDTVLYKNHNKVLDHFTDGLWSWATMVSIMMTPLDVHYQRAPTSATLISQEYVAGFKKNAMKNSDNLQATLQNEYNAMLFERDDGVRYRVIQIAWFVARRIVPYLEVGYEVEQGDVIGLIKFWSQVTIIFDSNVEVVAEIWDVVIDGETVLGKLR